MARRNSWLLATAITVALAGSTSVASALSLRGPQAGPASATLTLTETTAMTATTCQGDDPITPTDYITLAGGSWSGTIDDNGSMMIPYRLHGAIAVAGTIVINTGVSGGVFAGTVTVTGDTDPTIDATGPLRIPVVVDPTSGDYLASGMVDLPLYTAGKKNGSELIANIELTINASTGAIAGLIGGGGSFTGYVMGVEFNGLGCAGRL